MGNTQNSQKHAGSFSVEAMKKSNAELAAMFSSQLQAFHDGTGSADDVDMGVGGVVGGDDTYGSDTNFLGGGDNDIQNYANSTYSTSKEKLIREIAKDVFITLKVDGASKVSSAPINVIVSHLAKIVPGKDTKFKGNFGKDAKSQKDVCMALGRIINKHYGSEIVDLSGDLNVVCEKVAEVMNTLLVGLNNEFVTVAGDVLRTLSNMKKLNELIKANYNRQKELVDNSGDEMLKLEATMAKDFYEKLNEELNRQMAMVENMLNVSIGPSQKTLVQLLDETGDFKGLVSDLSAGLGTKEFSDKLGHMLSGVSNVTYSTHLINKALKDLGLSVQEFKKAKSPSDLRTVIYEHIQSKKPTSREFDKLMAAANVIYNHDYNHDAIVKAMGSTTGGDESELSGEISNGYDSDGSDGFDVYGGCGSDYNGGDCGSDHTGEVHGGADCDDNEENFPAYWSKKSLSKKIKNKAKFRKMLLKDFKKVLKSRYANIVSAVNEISKHVGTTIPLNSDLNKFINVFQHIQTINEKNLHVALSGYKKDVGSKDRRNDFLNYYNLLVLVSEPLTNGPGGAYFKNLQSAVKNLVTTVDKFSDTMLDTITEIHIDRPDEIAKAIRRTSNEFVGSAEGDHSPTKEFVEFEKIKRTLLYKYAIGNIKTNLSVVSKEMDLFGEGYEDVLGEEAGWVINKIKKEYDDLITKADPDNASRNATGVVLNAYATVGDDEAKRIKNVYKSLCYMWNMECDVKVKMVDAAQAIDLYLKAFANGVAKNPDTIKSILGMLEQVDIVAKWFTDRSGDNAAAVFEAFPAKTADDSSLVWNNNADGAAVIKLEPFDETKAKTVNDDGEFTIPAEGTVKHYFGWIDSQIAQNADNIPGNPFVGHPILNDKSLDRLRGLRKQTEKTIKSMRALENILSVFADVGKKFGDIDPQSKTFMKPGQIFNTLCEYVCVTAYTNHYNVSGVAAYGADVDGVRVGVSQNDLANVLSNVVKHTSVVMSSIPDTKSTNMKVKFDAANAVVRDFKHVQHLLKERNAALNKVIAGLVGIDVVDNGNDLSANTYGHNIQYNGVVAVAAVAGGLAVPVKYRDVMNDYNNKLTPVLARIAADNGKLAGTHAEITALANVVNQSKPEGVAADAQPLFNQTDADLDARLRAVEDASDIATNNNEWKYYDMNERDVSKDLSTCPKADKYGYQNRTFDTDGLFIMVVKSIAAKIFTMVDSYRLFNRPTEDSTTHDSLNPLRTILGGGSKTHVPVSDEATELYLRLPLLAEWYREMFGFKQNGDRGIAPANNGWKLSIVPNVDGVFGDFIKLMFDEVSYVTEGNYTESTIQKMIEAINHIHKSYKAREGRTTTRDILNAFIVEMNRVFGFLKQDEIKQYLESRRDNLKPDTYGDKSSDEYLDYDILNAEDNFGRGPAPSDRFVTGSSKVKSRPNRNMVHLQKAILDLRRRMDVDFRKANPNNAPNFVTSIANYAEEIKTKLDPKAKYDVVLRMIQGSNKMVDLNSDKLIMLHESVVAPLAVLHRITRVMTQFNNHLHGTSFKNVLEFGKKRNKVVVAGVAIDNIDNIKKFYESYLKFIKEKYPNASENQQDAFARALTTDKLSEDADKHTGYTNPGALAQNALNYSHVQWELILRDTLGSLLDLTSGPSSLVECNVGTNGNINVNFSKVQEFAVRLLSLVRKNITKLRTEFTDKDELFNQFEHSKYPGSTRWVEEHLVEVLLNNRDNSGLDIGVSEHLNNTFKYTSRESTPDNLQLAAVPAMPSMYNAIASHAYYVDGDARAQGLGELTGNSGAPDVRARAAINDLKTFPFNVVPVKVDKDLRDDDDKKHLQTLLSGKKNFAGNEYKKFMYLTDLPAIAFRDTAELNKWNLEHSGLKSLLFSFNDTVRKYLSDNLDNNSMKIYTPLFESYMNSSAAKEVIQGLAFPDIIGYGRPNMKDAAKESRANHALGLHPPPKATVLTASNAVTMKALINTFDIKLKKKMYMYDGLAEVPEYMKDRMRSNLPHYSKLFDIMSRRADLLRKLLSNSSVKDSVQYPGVATNNFGGVNANVRYFSTTVKLQDELFDATGKDAKVMSEHMLSILNKLVDSSNTMKRCVDSVYKELQDTAPYFMDLHEGFIENYKQSNGALPIMPASHVLMPQSAFNGTPSKWNENDGAKHMLLLPSAANGSDLYKFNRASRLLLGRSNIDPKMEHMPGAQDVYNRYASVASKHGTISAQEYADTIKLMVDGSRVLNDGTLMRLFDRPNVLGAPSAWDRNALGSLPGGAVVATAVVAFHGGYPTAAHTYTSNSPFNAMRSDLLDLKDLSDQLTRAGAPPGAVILGGVENLGDYQNIAKKYGSLFKSVTGKLIPDRAELANAVTDKSHELYEKLRMIEPTPYQVENSLSEAYTIAENTNQKNNRDLLASVILVPTHSATNDREQMRTHNILDMNVVPINVHAFMREVPFVNLLNYSYTFDRMIHDFVLPKYINAGTNVNNIIMSANAPVNDSREMMVKLLTHPYADVSEHEYNVHVGSLFNGNDDLKLGRPRYLSDQLWNKVLLNSPASVADHPNQFQLGPAGMLSNDPQEEKRLKYFNKETKSWEDVGNLDDAITGYLKKLGRMRFDTKLVRNLTWFVQIQRVIRSLLVEHLDFISAPVLSGVKIANNSITEYGSKDQYTPDDFNGGTYNQF